MKLVKRLLIIFSLFVLVVSGLAGVGYWRLKVDPEWYHPVATDPEASRLAANRADQKVVETLNWAASAQAAETRRRLGSTRPADSASVKTISFSEEELNAFFAKWRTQNHWDDHYSAYLDDPMISLQDGRIVFAGRLKEFPSVVSMHYEPVLTADGQLNIRLVRVLGGRLPMPRGILDRPLGKLETAARARLPKFQKGSRIGSDGAGNADALKAASLMMLLDTLDQSPADASLFLPIEDKRGLPVRITAVTIADKTLSLDVRVMTDTESARLMERLHGKSDQAVAKGE